MTKRFAIITSHPIQYNAPLFVQLAQEKGVELKVFYTWSQAETKVYDPGFGQFRTWDIPLLEGYTYTFVHNTASKPGSYHFWGIQNPSLVDTIQVFNPTVILVYGWSFYSHLQVIRYFKGKVPVWFRGDSHLLTETSHFSLKKMLRYIVLSWVYRHVDKAFYVGNANRDYYLKYGLKPSQLIFAPHAVDNSRFDSNHLENEAKANKWRLELGIPNESIVFLYVGKLEAIKNVELLINAFKQLGQPNVMLLIVGTGNLELGLKETAKNDPRILFLGFQNQSQMAIVYRLGELLVLPSKSETWGLTVNEAFACARPAIVSSKVGCASDLIIDGQTGWVFDAENELNLIRCLSEAIVQGQSGLQSMGIAANHLIQSWSYKNVVDSLKKELNAPQ